jgi:hypothetical protein
MFDLDPAITSDPIIPLMIASVLVTYGLFLGACLYFATRKAR